MPETALNFSEVTFGFGKRKPLFENFSCSLANDSTAGKIIALMGPSGVGKTTFCDLALGIRQPQKGSVKFAPENANIAVIPQKGVIFDELSVKDNITCLKYSKNLGKSFHEDKVQHAIESLDLSHVLQSGTHASALSGGEAQRVMLARIQTINCDVLILDEPCSFLDNRAKDSFLSALRATVDKSQFLALMVTHVWDEACQVADEVLFFHQSPGKPVTLHCETVAEAQDCPPTIDALFGIHWPDCLILDLTEGSLLASIPADKIPTGARFAGLFHKSVSNSEDDHWSIKFWVKARKPSISNVRTLRARIPVIAEHRNIASAFYNADGLLLKELNPRI